MMRRGFPPPWSVDELPLCRKETGQRLTYIYFEDARRAAVWTRYRDVEQNNNYAFRINDCPQHCLSGVRCDQASSCYTVSTGGL
jgi:hypothetical protein